MNIHNHSTFEENGKPFFYLADTCWSAFTNITDEEWHFYLHRRKMQGFNTIQINILPQWDASGTALSYHPFIDGDPMRLNDAYFEHAEKMCEEAAEAGFHLALVVLWSNYVPETWASRLLPSGVLPYEFIEPYVHKVHETFTRFKPFYIISGDTDFNTEETVRYYVKAASVLRPLAQDCLFSTHIKGRYSEIPAELLKYLDFLMYQSGHNAKDPAMPYKLCETMRQKYPGMPVINAEPCYEQMGYSGNMYGRWTQFDIRKAAYSSILAGANAGITYGAAGIYSWHKVEYAFMSKLGEGFDAPKSWEEAMNFPGAWDYGWLRHKMEELDIRDLEPQQERLLNQTDAIRLARIHEKQWILYCPYNTKIRLNMPEGQYCVRAYDLMNGHIADVSMKEEKDHNAIELYPFAQDAFMVIDQL